MVLKNIFIIFAFKITIMDNDMKIMEFLGYKTHKHKTLNTLQWDCPDGSVLENILKGRLFLMKLHFQDDWNWLMEVVEYIEGLGFSMEIVERTVFIKHVTNGTKFYSEVFPKDYPTPKTKKEVTYESVIAFINWYKRPKTK